MPAASSGARTVGWSSTSVPPPQADVIEPTVVVPVDLEVDDRLVGPVTFRLAGWLAVVAAGLTLAALSWPAVGPTAAGALLLIVGAAGALIRPAGRPLLWWAGPLWAYRRRQRSRAGRPDHPVQPAADAVTVEAAGPATESATAAAHDQSRGDAGRTGSAGVRTPLDETPPPAHPATTFAASASTSAAAAPSTDTAPVATRPKSEARSSSPALSWQTEVEWRAQRRAARRPAVVGFACALAISGGVAIPVRLAGSGHFAPRAIHGVDNGTAADQARTASGTGVPTSQPTPSSAPTLPASSPGASPAATAVPSAAASWLANLLLTDPGQLDGPASGSPTQTGPSSRPSAAPSSGSLSPDSSDDLLPLWLLLYLLDGSSCDSSC